jgi:hypothetical protein
MANRNKGASIICILNEINLFEWILCYHPLVSPTGRSIVVGEQSSDNSYIGRVWLSTWSHIHQLFIIAYCCSLVDLIDEDHRCQFHMGSWNIFINNDTSLQSRKMIDDWCDWVHKVIFINCSLCFVVGRPTLNSISYLSPSVEVSLYVHLLIW